MGRKALILFVLSALPTLVFADEKLAMLKAGNDIYTNVTVMSVSATDVYFTYAHGNGVGMANVKLKSLEPALQKHFNYNATNALEVEQKQYWNNTQYHAYIVGHPAPAPPNEDRPTPSTATAGAGALWRTDLPGALQQAQTENKLVLLDFTGSDWCPWCIKFDQEVLSTSQFADYANARLILVKLDFPHNTPQSEDLRRANAELANRFHVDGYPTYVLLNAGGNELGRQVGYQPGGPGAFIAELEGFSKR